MNKKLCFQFFQAVQSVQHFKDLRFMIASVAIASPCAFYFFHLIASSGDLFDDLRNEITNLLASEEKEFVIFSKFTGFGINNS